MKLNSPKMKVSFETKILLNISKLKNIGYGILVKEKGSYDSFKPRKEARYNSREMIQNERAMEREIFYSQLIQKPSLQNPFPTYKKKCWQ